MASTVSKRASLVFAAAFASADHAGYHVGYCLQPVMDGDQLDSYYSN